MRSEELTIIIGGDTVPTRSNESFLINGQEAEVFNGVKNMFLASDLAIVNLECPLTDAESEIIKAGPCLKAKPDTINGLVKTGINVFSLANNHIMDFGPKGLEDTIQLMKANEVIFTGAGENLKEARKILLIEKRGIKIAIISVAEHEFSIAEEDAPGANPYDPFDTMEDIRNASLSADTVIVLYHGGIEHYELPSPNLQRVCRKMVENGAAYVICQHSHCIGSYEKYLGGHIVYGQGNLLFDNSNHEMWHTGLLIKLTIEASGGRIEFLPILKKRAAIDLAGGDEKERIIRSFNERSQNISDKQYVEKEWGKFSNKKKYHYLQTFLGFGSLIRGADNRLGNLLTKFLVSRFLLNRYVFTLLYDFVICESHLEMTKRILRETLTLE